MRFQGPHRSARTGTAVDAVGVTAILSCGAWKAAQLVHGAQYGEAVICAVAVLIVTVIFRTAVSAIINEPRNE